MSEDLRYPLDDTIAAIATAPGRGAVAIVRISGAKVRDIAARVFFAARALRPRVATFGRIVGHDGVTVDRGLALLFPGPESYTGEDVLELHVHGSPAVARDTLVAALAAGARMAGPGEFTRRAFLNGKLDLTAAEAVGELIAAEHRAGARAAAARLGGGLAREVEALQAALHLVLEELAAAVDFPDEVETPAPDDLVARVGAVDARLARLVDDWERGLLVREGASVALVGPPNAGKSSLLNALLGAERAIVSEVPGTTRDTIEEALGLGAFAVRLIDTAGMRDAADALEAAGIARSEASLASARLALVVVDGARPLDDAARALLERTRGRDRVVLFNKADLGRAGYDARDPADADALLGSAFDPVTVDAVRGKLAGLLGADTIDLARPHLGTARQLDAVLEARRALAHVLATLDAGDPADLTVGDLLEASAALGALSGRDAGEALLDAIFARFCIGK